MRDRLSALPDEILCSMLSLLTLRDSIRTRLLSARWRYLLDDRSVLYIHKVNLLESEMSYFRSYDEMPKLVRAVDQILELRKCRNHSALKLFGSNIQASDVDRWVESGIKMKIESLQLYSGQREDNLNMVPVKLFQSYHSRKSFHLKDLLLLYCALTLSSGCTSWISHLTTLELACVSLQQKDIECVVSGSLNLTSLSLYHCGKTDYLPIIVQLPLLKDLLVSKSKCFKQVELICPNLQSIECFDQEAMVLKFSYVPLLKKVVLSNAFLSPNYSLMFDEFARDTPKLNELSFDVLTEVEPFPASITLCCLKRLDLHIEWFNHYDETSFDLLSIAYLLNASPFLEILHLQKWRYNNEHNRIRLRVHQRAYLDNPHIHLKEVKIEGFKRTWDEMELVRYLLKNVVALERMILEDSCYCSSTREKMGTSSLCAPGTALSYATICGLPRREEMVTTYCSLKREEMAKSLLKDLETNAELVFMTNYVGVMLTASNRVGYGLRLYCPDPKERAK